MKTRGTRIAYSFYQILGVDWPEGFLLAPTKYCCSLLKRMQLTCKAWVESLNPLAYTDVSETAGLARSINP